MQVAPGMLGLVESSQWLYGSRYVYITALSNASVYGIEVAEGELTIECFRAGEGYQLVDWGRRPDEIALLKERYDSLTEPLKCRQDLAKRTLDRIEAEYQVGQIASSDCPLDQVQHIERVREGLIAKLDIPEGVTHVELHRWFVDESGDEDTFEFHFA